MTINTCPQCDKILQISSRTTDTLIVENCPIHGIILQYDKNGIKIKHRGLKSSLTSLIAFTGVYGGIILGWLVGTLMQKYLHLHGMAFVFGLITFGAFLVLMISLSSHLGQKWKISDENGKEINQ